MLWLRVNDINGALSDFFKKYIYRGAFDISLIASIASHLTYWADEDVNHFVLSQVLSRRGRH